jgi:hypothetical protein
MERPYKSLNYYLRSYFLFPSYVVLHGWETQPRASRAISYFLFLISYFLFPTFV